MAEDLLLVGARDGPGISSRMVSGAKLYKGSCGHMVWLSPAGQGRLREASAVKCMECAQATVQMSQIEPFMESTLDELERVWGYRPTQEELFLKLAKYMGWL